MSAPPIGRTSRTPKRRAPSRSTTTQMPASGRAAATPRRGAARRRGARSRPAGRGRGSAARQELLELPEGDEAPEKEIEPISAEKSIAPIHSEDVARVRREPVELGRRDQRRRAAADAVEERHHLRHRGHPHEARRGDADHRPDGDPGRRSASRCRCRRVEEREEDRDRHPDRGDDVARARGRRRGEPLDPDDQEDAGDEVGEVDRGLREREAASLGVVARRLALEHLEHAVGDEEAADDVDRREDDRDEREHLLEVESAEPAMSIAPTRTMPWIAFVPDMSGVCSSVGTREISSKPRKTARTKIVMLLRASGSRAHGSLSTRPSWVTHVSRVISSSKSSASSPSSEEVVEEGVETLREYIWLACSGHRRSGGWSRRRW